MVDPLAGWHDEHAKFAQLLDILKAQVDAFHRGEHPNYDLMSDIVYYLRSFADCVHHPREDVAFRRLVMRDAGSELVINRLLREHRVITTAGDELLSHLDEAARDVLAPREALLAAAATYLVYYRNHLATEEREILPRAAYLLTADDWVAVIATIPAMTDPLFGDNVDARFQKLRRQIDREVALSLEG